MDSDALTQSCATLCDPMDCTLPGSFICGIFQARVLEWASLASQRHPGKFPKVPGRRRGTRGFPAAPRQRPRESFFNAHALEPLSPCVTSTEALTP